jgi:hypothetical protein
MRALLILLVCGWFVVLLPAATDDTNAPNSKVASQPTKAKFKPKLDESPSLPELTDSAGIHVYTICSLPAFDLEMDCHLRVTIFPKDKGQRIGQPVYLSAPSFHLTGIRHQFKASPTISEFIKPPPPRKQAEELEINGQLNNEAVFGLKYKFQLNSLYLSGWLRNTPAAEQATPLEFHIVWPETHTFTPNIELADRKKAMPGWYIKTREKSDQEQNYKSYAYTYWDLAKFKPEAQSMEVFGPWGTRKIMVHTSGPGVGNFSLEMGRRHRYPYNGFECLFRVPTANSKKKTESSTLVITVE